MGGFLSSDQLFAMTREQSVREVKRALERNVKPGVNLEALARTIVQILKPSPFACPCGCGTHGPCDDLKRAEAAGEG